MCRAERVNKVVHVKAFMKQLSFIGLGHTKIGSCLMKRKDSNVWWAFALKITFDTLLSRKRKQSAFWSSSLILICMKMLSITADTATGFSQNRSRRQKRFSGDWVQFHGKISTRRLCTLGQHWPLCVPSRDCLYYSQGAVEGTKLNPAVGTGR